MKSIETRFCEYVQIDTQSDPNSLNQPSTEKQKDLSRVLVKELLEMGLKDAHLDEFGYVYATLPSNVDREVPVLCFCAHVDTSPDCTGAGVKPLVHRNYQGQDLILPDDTSQVISPKDHPYLLERIGDDIVTASGTTLLGADDKAGVAVIMDFVQHMVNHPELPHGAVKILFTPDEEIGRGVDKVNIEKLGAQIGYTLDAGERGCYEDETFSADGAKVHFYGVSAHPGYAKDKLVNALKLGGGYWRCCLRQNGVRKPPKAKKVLCILWRWVGLLNMRGCSLLSAISKRRNWQNTSPVCKVWWMRLLPSIPARVQMWRLQNNTGT